MQKVIVLRDALGDICVYGPFDSEQEAHDWYAEAMSPDGNNLYAVHPIMPAR